MWQVTASDCWVLEKESKGDTLSELWWEQAGSQKEFKPEFWIRPKGRLNEPFCSEKESWTICDGECSLTPQPQKGFSQQLKGSQFVQGSQLSKVWTWRFSPSFETFRRTPKIVEKPLIRSLHPTSLKQQSVTKDHSNLYVFLFLSYHCGQSGKFSLKVFCCVGQITVTWLIQCDMCLLISQLSRHIVLSSWAKGVCQCAGSCGASRHERWPVISEPHCLKVLDFGIILT